MDEDLHPVVALHSESTLSDPQAGSAKYAGAFFPSAQNFVVAGGVFTTNVTNTIHPDRDSEQERNEKQLRKIVDWLKPLDIQGGLDTILQLRQPGTCEWFLESESVNTWKASTSGSFLWLHGIPGNGKTVISSVLVEHLLRERARDDAVLYAFCDFRDHRSVDPVAILTTFLAEMLLTYPCSITPDFDDLVDAEKKGRKPPQTVSRLVPLIRKAAQRFRRVCIILDGLDECQKRNPLLELLPNLSSDDGFHVFVASRTEQDIREAFAFAETASLQIEWLNVQNDIIRHISRELQRRPQLARLSQDIQDTIREILSSKASGMFRLVQCQLDLLSRTRTYKSLMGALQNLPTTLLEMYDHILERIEDSSQETPEIARRALRWIAGARWPIRLAELAEAIMIEPRCRELNGDYLVTSNTVILEILSGFVIHKTESDVVNLSHFSVLEYLMSSYLLESPFSSYYLPAESVLTNETFSLIIDYVLMDEFNRPLFQVEDEFHHFFDDKHPLYRDATNPGCWKTYLSFVDADSIETFVTLWRFVHAADTPDATHWNLLQQRWATDFSRTLQTRFVHHDHEHHPLPYFITQHICPAFLERTELAKLPAQLLECCIFASIHVGHTPAMELLLDLSGADPDQIHEHPCLTVFAARSPLIYAIESHALPAARVLLERGADACAVMIDGWSALHAATQGCLVEGVELLLQNPDVNVHARDISGRTPYMIAAHMGAQAILNRLVDFGAMEELNSAEMLEEKPGSEEVLQVGLCVNRMLRGRVKLVPIILDLAEYWTVLSVKRTDPQGVVFHSDSPVEPYVTLTITGRRKPVLRRVVFTIVSHDQGWSSHEPYIGTYQASYSWFDVSNDSVQTSGRTKRLQSNVHGSMQKRTHRIVWDSNVRSSVADWMSTFSDGDVLKVYARAEYQGWENHVYSAEVMAYTACL